MSTQNGLEEPQRLELLAGRVLNDLSDDERSMVNSVLKERDSGDVLLDLEKTAAAVQLALHHVDPVEMPPELVERLRREGLRIADANRARNQQGGGSVDLAGGSSSSPSSPESIRSRRSAGGVSLREAAAWFCAAAALLLALGLWTIDRDPVTTKPSATVRRAEMLSQDRSLVRADWQPGKTPFEEPVAGDIVWDPQSQTGFMRFEGMPVNNPAEQQYQLWIIDPARDAEPIDGGVFNITDSGEAVVEIDAKLDVIDPAAFAVTIEQPGGVVVSDQERLPLLAPVEKKQG